MPTLTSREGNRRILLPGTVPATAGRLALGRRQCSVYSSPAPGFPSPLREFLAGRVVLSLSKKRRNPNHNRTGTHESPAAAVFWLLLQ